MTPKPQLGILEEIEGMAKKLKHDKIAPHLIIATLDDWLIVRYGYSRTTRQDYLKMVKKRVWPKGVKEIV